MADKPKQKKMTEPSKSDDIQPQPDAKAATVLSTQLNWFNSPKVSDPHTTLVVEYPLYSDAHITGEFREGLGPYSFLNTVPFSKDPGTVNTPIILRVAVHLPDYYPPDMSGTDESLYYGGFWVDELAALTSVALGVRIRAGGETRRFEPGQDPYGQPHEWQYESKPIVRAQSNQLILPSVVDKHSMDQLKILESIPRIAPKRYVSLIRACRSYQNALWIAESEPNLAWLMFVSALETAANDFYETDASPDTRLRDLKPDLAKLLKKHGGDELVYQVAELVAHLFGATKKFINFTMRFMPDESDQRPDQEWLQVKWSKTGLKKVLNKVYEYRSRSLHEGKPYPAPMLRPPHPGGKESPPSEVPSIGLASSSQGGTWLKKAVPINLHCFQYITRGVLLNWWRDALTQSSPHLDQDMEKAS